MEELELSVELDELEGGTGAVADLLGGPVGLVTALLSNLDLVTHLEATGRSVVLIQSINQFNSITIRECLSVFGTNQITRCFVMISMTADEKF